MDQVTKLADVCRKIRYGIISATSAAGSGHPSSSLSAVELMAGLFFGGLFRYDSDCPQALTNDRVIFSKGHAAPLLYALWWAASAITKDELITLRQFGSRLQGHPTPDFPYVDVATGSLGQGLSIGLGMALAIKRFRPALPNPPRAFVLLGDSELAEGQNWEAVQLAVHYRLDNLIAIVDVNRLGQRGETMVGWNIVAYQKRFAAFGWDTILIEDGHDLSTIIKAYQQIKSADRPTAVIAKTIKGKGVAFMENQDAWHGKVIPSDRLDATLKALGKTDLEIKGKITKPDPTTVTFPAINNNHVPSQPPSYAVGDQVAPRSAYGEALVASGKTQNHLVVLDAEVSNSTYSDKFAHDFPDRFFEMYIAEQNMISVALGMSKLGYRPFVSSFAAFLTRAFDQLRMCQYSRPDLKVTGSHAGVSIGADGASQMGLEDIAMMRSLLNSTVFYPSDAVSVFKLTELMARTPGLIYLRTTREKLPVIYRADEVFKVGGSKIIHQSNRDQAVVFAAGITVHEAMKAYVTLQKRGVNICVVDLYCVKPLDQTTIVDLTDKTKNAIVVEDHYPAGGLGEAVLSGLANHQKRINRFIHLCVNKLPRSGPPAALMHEAGIDADAIVAAVLSCT
ncbi:transketolase [Patescibacteria group bacterium]|nr:transketolase [Patescibacteria group bacterium]MCL5091578.1 transketolase [Patescibacteria group bacterium]